MKAMILAAGKGTRLKPLTDNTPKALVKVNGTPMLEIIIKKLMRTGVNELIINVHYLSNQIIEFLTSNNNFGLQITISNESNELLDTGGGLKKASHFFNNNKPFILYNTDIISNINLQEMLDEHIKHKALVTLAVRNRKSSRYFLFNKNLKLSGWKNTKTSEEIITKKNNNLTCLAFSGIHILDPKIFKLMPNINKFSIVDTYLKLSKNYRIHAYDHSQDYWFDVGDITKLNQTQEFLNSKQLS